LSSKYIEEMFNVPVGKAARAPVTVSTSEPASIVVKKMIKEDIGAVVVVEKGKPVGLITEKDLLERVIQPRKDLNLTLAGDVMSKPLISIEFDRPLKEALELMQKHDFRRLVVTKKGALHGLVTERRLLEAAFLVT